MQQLFSLHSLISNHLFTTALMLSLFNSKGYDARLPGIRLYVQGGQGGGCQPNTAPKRHYVQPNWNGGAYQTNKICNACCCFGHVVANCDILIIALLIEKYKQNLLNNMKDHIESKWLLRWKDSLGNPAKKPQQVL
jgi:hypothetical protein